MNTGIYTITSPSGKQYVGSANSFKDRWSAHRRELRLGIHHNKPLMDAYRKYGEDGLVFEKIIICAKADLLVYEQIAIDALNPAYNILRRAGSALGAKYGPFTPEHSAALSASLKGKKRSPEYRAWLSASQKGKKKNHSDETRAKKSAAMKGRKIGPRPLEHRIAISAARKNTSGYRGVYFHKGTEKWCARANVNRRQTYLGLFEDPKVAYEAVLAAEAKLLREAA